MSVRLLLVVDNRDARIAYAKVLMRMGAQFETVASVSDLHRLLPQLPFNGLLMDVDTMQRAGRDEKAFVHDLIQLFPSMRITWDAAGCGIKTIPYGQSQEGGGLEDFINRLCRPFEARTLRTAERSNIHFNVYLSPAKDFPPASTEKSITMNASTTGCFIYSTGNWEGRQDAWIKVMELEDPTPIQVEICWRKEWGKHMSIPGIGIRFMEISDWQMEEVGLIVGKSPLLPVEPP